MSGAALAVATLTVTSTLAFGMAAAAAAAVHTVRLAGVADAAALAAADAALGAATGIPCERAEDITRLASAHLGACTLDGAIATVRVEAAFGVFPAAAQARAGPKLSAHP